MKTLIQAIAISGAVVAPAFAQEAPQEAGAQLDTMTCREFLGLSAEDQTTVMLAMRAHVNGDPLPDVPLPIGLEAENGGADGLGGDSGDPSAEDLADGSEGAAGEADAGGVGQEGEATAAAGATTGAEGSVGEASTETADEDAASTADEGTTATSVGDEEVVDGEKESGKVNPDGTEVSVTDEPADPKLTAMRTSCEGGPDALATDAMRAAHADYE